MKRVAQMVDEKLFNEKTAPCAASHSIMKELKIENKNRPLLPLLLPYRENKYDRVLNFVNATARRYIKFTPPRATSCQTNFYNFLTTHTCPRSNFCER